MSKVSVIVSRFPTHECVITLYKRMNDGDDGIR